jgi:phytanoyl-CoA hydroxylase
MNDHTRFSPEEVSQFKAQGFLVVKSLFHEEEMARLQDIIGELTRSAVASGEYESILELEPGSTNEAPVARRIYNPFQQHEAFANLARDDRMLDRVEQLFGHDLALQHSKLNMKPARVGSAVEWHQDLSYFPHTNDDLLAALVYLDEATRLNGALQVIPGQHRGYLRHEHADGTFAGMITEDVEGGRYAEPVTLEAPAGSVIFMHCLTPHSSAPNRSDTPRRTLIYEYQAADAYPIEFGDHVVQTKTPPVLLRGKPARFARLGGIAPLIPRFPEAVSSLYDLQSKSRQQKTA